MTEIYSNEHGALIKCGPFIYLRVPTQVEVTTQTEEIAGLDMTENEPGSFRLCLDKVSVYGCHGWEDREDFGGRVSVIRYAVKGLIEADKIDVPVPALQDLIARYDELEHDPQIQ